MPIYIRLDGHSYLKLFENYFFSLKKTLFARARTISIRYEICRCRAVRERANTFFPQFRRCFVAKVYFLNTN